MSDFCKEINKLGKGIGNAARYRIIESLAKGRKTVGELVKAVRLSQPAVSQHLKTLKECNIVTDMRQGKEVFYEINTQYTVNLLRNLLSDLNKQKVKK